MTLSKKTVKEARKEEARESRKQWMTSFGWRNRGCMDSFALNRHPLCPDQRKIDELMIVSVELWFLGVAGRYVLPRKDCILSVYAKTVETVGISAVHCTKHNFDHVCVSEVNLLGCSKCCQVGCHKAKCLF